MSAGIYLITNITTGKFYIGSAVNVASRWQGHRSRLRKGQHANQILQNAWNKYGDADFAFAVIERVEDRAHLLQREQFWLDMLAPAFNIYKVAGSPAGYKHSDEFKQRARERMLNYRHTDEAKARIAASKIGKSRPDHVKKALLDANVGRKQTAEHVSKRVVHLVGKKQTAERIASRVAHFIGKKRPADVIARMISTRKRNREAALQEQAA